ncbi:MAG: CRISPR-associated helicase Cas3' [PVC group bacterium]|nr:CRISPR-associated helicase Cas3' [PVC group bacterium]
MQRGVNVAAHCKIIGKIALELIKREPQWLQDAFFPPGSELVAASHDIGKVSPAFQEKIHRSLGIILNLANPELDKIIGYHATVSQSTLVCQNEYIPRIIGKHHGMSPAPQNLGIPEDEKYGGKNWQNLREELVTELKNTFKNDWPEIQTSLQSDVLSGLTCVADWIGSGSLFDNKEKLSDTIIAEAVDRAGFVPPRINTRLNFEDIFTFSPKQSQIKLIDTVTSQGAFVLEAPMGSGKTEAALYAAYRAMEEGSAKGIYFALPTQLTSDKIYHRMNKFLEKIIAKDCPHRHSLLLHGSAWLKYTELGEEGQPGRSWFNSNKRGLLAPFAVGTIDQALMAVMNVKHGFVRDFGLAGKVVILDEVHSYDSYTGTLLNHLVKALRELCCTVIVLSATLTADRRTEILTSIKSKDVASDEPYPLITALPKNGSLKCFEIGNTDNAIVRIKIIKKDEKALEQALLRAERGEQVLWVENTVNEAQDHFRQIGARAKEMGIEYGLLHSRFLKTNREKNEEYWVKLYGKEGREMRRNKGRILVGTQVVEQSIDIDADFLITRLCPTDMLLQRIGRLWRHRENDATRPQQTKQDIWILSPRLQDLINEPNSLGKSVKVYAPYVLCRTLEVWESMKVLYLPAQIRTLLEKTYKEQQEQGYMAIYKKEIEDIRDKLERFALIGISKDGLTLPESKASTRYSDIKTVEVLLIREMHRNEKRISLKFLDDTTLLLPAHHKDIDHKRRREIASVIYRNTVHVPEYCAPQISLSNIAWLRGYAYLGNTEENPFRATLVSMDGSITGFDYNVVNDKYDLQYDSMLGYVTQKK